MIKDRETKLTRSRRYGIFITSLLICDKINILLKNVLILKLKKKLYSKVSAKWRDMDDTVGEMQETL